MSVRYGVQPQLTHVPLVRREEVRIARLDEPCHPRRQDDQDDTVVIAFLGNPFVYMAFGCIEKQDDLILFQFFADVNGKGVNQGLHNVSVHPCGFRRLDIDVPRASRHDSVIFRDGENVLVPENELRQFPLNARVVANECCMRESCTPFFPVGELNWFTFGFAFLDDVTLNAAMKGRHRCLVHVYLQNWLRSIDFRAHCVPPLPTSRGLDS